MTRAFLSLRSFREGPIVQGPDEPPAASPAVSAGRRLPVIGPLKAARVKSEA